MAVEFARNVCGLKDANSVEFDADAEFPIIAFMADQSDEMEKGGTMRLGSYPCELAVGSKAAAIYDSNEIQERHRHRLEFNNAFRETLTEGGMHISGKSPDGTLVEMIEHPDHPWFIGCQFHPEFKSQPTQAHPLFASYIEACVASR